jgi:hypothetical protein
VVRPVQLGIVIAADGRPSAVEIVARRDLGAPVQHTTNRRIILCLGETHVFESNREVPRYLSLRITPHSIPDWGDGGGECCLIDSKTEESTAEIIFVPDECVYDVCEGIATCKAQQLEHSTHTFHKHSLSFPSTPSFQSE